MEPPKVTLETLRLALRAVEPAALLVEPRILRRVIRLDRRLPGLGLSVPHRTNYVIDRDRLLAFVERSELNLSPAAELPRTVILLSEPVDDEALDLAPHVDVRRRYDRLLFHARAHVALEQCLAAQNSAEAWAEQRRRQLGVGPFAEIQAVLLKEEYLFPSPSDLETYVEFVAFYLELRCFAEDELPLYFPAVSDWAEVDRIVRQDLAPEPLFAAPRLAEAPELRASAPQASAPADADAAPEHAHSREAVSLSKCWKLQARAERAAAVGNSVKAAIWHTRAARFAPPKVAREVHAQAHQELMRLASRLQTALQLSDAEAEQWRQALAPLLPPAAQGYWSHEARLLYDLQKVCIEQERGVFKLDLIDWIRTWGKRPIRRPLPLLREVLITRRLRSADRRVPGARISDADRERLAALLAAAVHRSEHRSRNCIRPLMVEVFDEVGLVPQNTPERVARRKLIEELLDHVVEQGHISMGHLRDALSKNDLKLPDVAGLSELIFGDRLLRADRKLDVVLDGVYRRGAVYLRWPQTLSSLGFGTAFGRFVTKYVVMPFGGAYLTLEFIRHVIEAIVGHPPPPGASLAEQAHSAAELAAPQWSFLVWVLLLGVWLSLLLHSERFRAGNLAVVYRAWRLGRRLLIDLPARVLRSPLVQRILNSPAYLAFQAYVLRPALVTALIGLPAFLVRRPWSLRTLFEIFLGATAMLNSPVGRYVTELTTDFLVRAWHELRMRVFAAMYQWIMDVFHGLMMALDRVVYTVDEWLRFRAGDNRFSQAVKLVGGVVWFFVSYVVVFVFTLLVEPQINPIKHFPVVTVSHKVILPSGPMFVKQLTPYLGAAQANTLVWTTIWLIPGVFGFLVWELKENWRLYDANRRPTLRPVPIGHHGETMVRLLRPGFHSGTFPKLYSGLRRTVRKAERTGNWNLVNNKLAQIERVGEDVRRFVEREFIELLKEADFLGGATLTVSRIRTSTNRIDVDLTLGDEPANPVTITWQDHAGRLGAWISRTGWLTGLSASDRELFATALAGLFQRSGVEAEYELDAPAAATPISWDHWVATWSPPPARSQDPAASISIATSAH